MRRCDLSELKLFVDDSILHESIFIVGSVSSVEGRKVKVKVNKNKNLSHLSFHGRLIKNVSVGGYVKIVKGFVEIIGKVEGEYTTREKVFSPEYRKAEELISRFLDISLYGHFEAGRFRQGIKEMPLIDNQCFLLTREEFERLHAFHQPGEAAVTIGRLADDHSQEVKLGVTKLFASHTGIFGNTGSGKSNTLARLYSALFRAYEGNLAFHANSKFIFLDLNGEYAGDGTLTPHKSVFNLSTRTAGGDKYPLPLSTLQRLEIISVLLEATEKTQKPFLSRALSNDYLNQDFVNRSRENLFRLVTEILQKGDPNLGIAVFSELFTHLKPLEDAAHPQIPTYQEAIVRGRLKFHRVASTYYTSINGQDVYANAALDQVRNAIFPNLNQITINPENFGLLVFKILSQYYHEIINGYSMQEHIRPLIGRMFKKVEMLSRILSISEDEVKTENVEVINLKDVNLEMKKTIPLIIAKQHYDDSKARGAFDKRSLHIVIDEAHNLLSSASERESETWKDYRLETFEELIKEGRKFSCFLTIASQRPFDISSTIISQLHNYFIHRLINSNDINAVERAVAYLDKLSFESIPVLPVGCCFVAGLASDIPIKVDIDFLPEAERPRSETIDLQKAWSEEVAENQEEGAAPAQPWDDETPF